MEKPRHLCTDAGRVQAGCPVHLLRIHSSTRDLVPVRASPHSRTPGFRDVHSHKFQAFPRVHKLQNQPLPVYPSMPTAAPGSSWCIPAPGTLHRLEAEPIPASHLAAVPGSCQEPDLWIRQPRAKASPQDQLSPVLTLSLQGWILPCTSQTSKDAHPNWITPSGGARCLIN